MGILLTNGCSRFRPCITSVQFYCISTKNWNPFGTNILNYIFYRLQHVNKFVIKLMFPEQRTCCATFFGVWAHSIRIIKTGQFEPIGSSKVTKGTRLLNRRFHRLAWTRKQSYDLKTFLFSAEKQLFTTVCFLLLSFFFFKIFTELNTRTKLKS